MGPEEAGGAGRYFKLEVLRFFPGRKHIRAMLRRRRQPETTSEPLRELVKDLTVRVADCVARVDSLETRWKDAQDQLRRSYQRLEKAGQRLDSASGAVTPEPSTPSGGQGSSGKSFHDKWLKVRG